MPVDRLSGRAEGERGGIGGGGGGRGDGGGRTT